MLSSKNVAKEHHPMSHCGSQYNRNFLPVTSAILMQLVSINSLFASPNIGYATMNAMQYLSVRLVEITIEGTLSMVCQDSSKLKST